MLKHSQITFWRLKHSPKVSQWQSSITQCFRRFIETGRPQPLNHLQFKTSTIQIPRIINFILVYKTIIISNFALQQLAEVSTLKSKPFLEILIEKPSLQMVKLWWEDQMFGYWIATLLSHIVTTFVLSQKPFL